MSYRITVRGLCEFAAREGDLDVRYQAAPSAEEGIAGHQRIAARRGTGYQSEISLQGRFGLLEVRGRADGFDPQHQRLEEFKTHRGDWQRIPAAQQALHWAQLKVHGHLYCLEQELDEIELALVYLDITSERETLLPQRFSAAELAGFFEQLCTIFLGWAEQELAHRAARDQALRQLSFPCASFRPGQRELAAAVYRCARDGGQLLAQAPTGIGKTLGTLFPTLRALPEAGLDRLFFLCARTPGRQLALNALQQLPEARPLRVLELAARDTLCEQPGLPCQGDACPLAAGFFDRLPAARQQGVQAQRLDLPTLRRIAAEHRLCPYYLGQEMARWTDLCVGDYNHCFDTTALLHGLAQANQWRVALLIDEAHNLIERARGMYSAELDPRSLAAARQAAPKALKSVLERVARRWSALQREHGLGLSGDEAGPLFAAPAPTRQQLIPLPEALLKVLEEACAVLAGWRQEHGELPAALLDFYFEALALCRLGESFGEHSLFELSLPAGARRARLALRNLLPAPFVGPRLTAAHSVVLFSATLAPARYQRDLLGLAADSRWLEIGSPFAASQLQVRLTPLSTRQADRQRSLAPLVELVAEQCRSQPGNYLLFCSSFDYLQRIAAQLTSAHPQIPLWSQQRSMDEAARRTFLERFVEGGRGIGLAVLGGVFGEGIDLPGERLIGAFVATLGLPPPDLLNEELRRRLQERFGRGREYAYLVPGLQKVIQAAGRVIRGPADRGTLHLIDDRFARREVRALLPGWWGI